ncbi:MAG: hypothetical protein ABSC18_17625, partial [Verrucomicrobiota bacterium]
HQKKHGRASLARPARFLLSPIRRPRGNIATPTVPDSAQAEDCILACFSTTSFLNVTFVDPREDFDGLPPVPAS